MTAFRAARRTALALLAAAALFGLAFPLRTAAAGLIQDGPAPDLTLLYTGDVIGFVDPCG